MIYILTNCSWILSRADEIFLERHMSKEHRLDSFAETHAKLAKESADRLNSLGESLFQVLQGEQTHTKISPRNPFFLQQTYF
jgi:hypothetical protein